MALPQGRGISLTAPAKINLTLCIGKRRPDGYHDLESLFQAVDLYDRVTLHDLPDGAGIALTASDPALPCDERNTAYRAARLVCEHHAPGRAVAIHLEKEIPAEAGLGGGSSDAASVLLGLNRLWQLGLPNEELRSLAAAVGSDVPFFITGGCALVRGRGERVTPLPCSAPGYFVLVRPPFGVSTARAYADLAAGRAGSDPAECAPVTDAACTAVEWGDPMALAAALANDLEGPIAAIHPEIGDAKRDLMSARAVGALMSGSGSTLFGLFADEAEARAGAADLGGRWPWVRLVRPIGMEQAQ